jgi:hypothetical protein
MKALISSKKYIGKCALSHERNLNCETDEIAQCV